MINPISGENVTQEDNVTDSDKVNENNKPKITVIIPTLNEEESIGQTIDEIPKDFADLEIIIVDGLSKDKTVEIATKKGARAVMEKRKGYGRAYKTGFKEANGDHLGM